MTDLRTSRLLAFARELQSAATFAELLVITQTELSSAMGYAHAWLFVAESEDADEWRLIDSAGANRGDVWKFAPVLRVSGDAMMEEIARSDEPVVVVDARTDPRTNKTIVEQLGNRTIVNVPLRLLDKPFGAFGTGTFGDVEGCRPPTPAQLDYLIGMAGQISVAAGRIRFLEERIRSEKALEKSERLFRGFRESGVIGIVVYKADGVITEANDAFLDMLGYSRDDLQAGRLNSTSLNTPMRERTDAAARLELAERGVAHAWEKELLHKNGTAVPVLMGVVNMDEAAGESVAFCLDLTQRQRAETALRESRARKEAVMEAALDAIVLMDHEGTIIEWNPAAERIFGYAHAEAIGKPLAELIVPRAQRAQHRVGLARYVATGEHKIIGKRIEVSACRKDGTEFPAEVAVVRIQSEGPPVFTGYIRDITERRQAAAAALLARENEAARAANKELETFSYSIAHDLRAPLRAMGGFSAVLLEDYADKLDDEGKRMLTRVAAGAQRMGELIDALLGLSRLSRTEIARERVDLSELARAVLDELASNDPSRSVERTVEDDLVVTGDPMLIRSVLENLLGNAWKFTKGRSPARIELRRTIQDGSACYCVRDNGAGFNMEHGGRLFTPFQRLHKAGEFEGSGVGLATVERIVRRHGGRAWAEGVENEGASFYFTLPA